MAYNKTKTRSPLALLLVGTIALIWGLIVLVPLIAHRIDINGFAERAETVMAQIDSREKTGQTSYEITLSYEYDGKQYNNIRMSTDSDGLGVAFLEPGYFLNVYIDSDDPTDCRLSKSTDMGYIERKYYIRYGLMAAGGIVCIISGIMVLVRASKKQEAYQIPPVNTNTDFRDLPPSPYDSGAVTGGVNTVSAESIRQASASSTATSFNSSVPVQPLTGSNQPYTANGPGFAPQPFTSNVQSPSPATAPQPFTSNVQSPSPAQTGAKPSFTSNKQGTVSLEKPKITLVNEQTVIKTQSTEENSVNTGPAKADPSQEGEQMQQTGEQVSLKKEVKEEKANEASSFDLESIVRKGDNNNLGEKALSQDTSKYDSPELNSLIRKGTDDAFNMKPEDYKVDPSLAALINTGKPAVAKPADENGEQNNDNMPKLTPEEETARLESIIRKGTDNGFSMRAEDYSVDPSLAAIIRKGTDDTFNSNADDYQADPELLKLVKNGAEDPFNGKPPLNTEDQNNYY